MGVWWKQELLSHLVLAVNDEQHCLDGEVADKHHHDHSLHQPSLPLDHNVKITFTIHFLTQFTYPFECVWKTQNTSTWYLGYQYSTILTVGSNLANHTTHLWKIWKCLPRSWLDPWSPLLLLQDPWSGSKTHPPPSQNLTPMFGWRAGPL